MTLGLALGTSLVSLPLAPNLGGVAATLAIVLGEAVVARRAGRTSASIKVTDYLDDIET